MTSNFKTPTAKTKCQIWWRRSLMERYLITICILMIVALIVMIGVLLYLIHSYRRPFIPVCHSAMCTREAGRIISYMNFSTDPCEDFYTFSCGSFGKDNQLPPHTSLLSLTELVDEDVNSLSKELIEAISEEEEQGYLKKVKMFYQSCLDRSTDTADIINIYLSKAGLRGWPILDNKVPDISKVLATVHIYGMSNPFYQFTRNYHYIKENSTLGNEISTYIYDKGKILVETEILTNITEEMSIKLKERYKKYLSYALYKSNVPLNVIESEADNIIAFETKLAQMMEDFKNGSSDLVETNLTDFLIDCDKISFFDSVRYIYEYLDHAEDFSEEMSINLYKTGYLERICELVKATDHRTLHNYLVWYFLGSKLQHIDPYYEEKFGEFWAYKRHIHYLHERKSRSNECIDNMLNNMIEPGVTYLLLNYMRADETVKEAKEYALEIKKAMEHMFSTESWIDPVMKNLSIHRMWNIETHLGYCNDSFNLTVIESYFNMINVTDNYFENDLENMKTLFKKALFNYTFPLNSDMPMDTPLMPIAHFTKEDIYIRMGYLIPPFFIPNGPKFFNYGVTGFTIGHELSHAFDNLDDRYLVENGTENWLNETIQAFIERKQCIMNQYSKYPLDENGTMVNGSYTSRDDISDNAGVFQSFAAYENYLKSNGEEPRLPGLDYTNQQMYFISYAQQWCEVVSSLVDIYRFDSHSPAKYRVNGPLQNFPRFSEAFSCPKDSPMNPLHKCRLYG